MSSITEHLKQKQSMNKSIVERMAEERFSLTCAPGGENHAGMEIIGRMPVKGEGLTASDIEGLGPYFQYLNFDNTVLNLNSLSGKEEMESFSAVDQARVLILRNWVQLATGGEPYNEGLRPVETIYKELAGDEWDAEYLDKNKYRTEMVDGKEVKVRGKRMNKRARTNLCYVAGREQEPAVMEGKGRIVDLKKKTMLCLVVEKIREMIANGLVFIGSKTKVEINVVEGNRYYNLKKTGIGFHGDTERVIVICISIGCDNYPMRWQWFKDGMPVGKPIDISLNCGDVYIMSEKAVGSDWKLSSKYTLRHSAGAEKYRSLKKWEKRRPAYEARLKTKAEIKAVKEAIKEAKSFEKQKERELRKALKNVKIAATKALKVKINDKKNKRKTTKGGALKKVVDPIKNYQKALKKHDWEDNNASFYRWVAIEANGCSSNKEFFKEFQTIWTGKAENFSKKMDMKEWEFQREFYRNLCEYGKYF